MLHNNAAIQNARNALRGSLASLIRIENKEEWSTLCARKYECCENHED
jgi:hypothetical protein